MKTNHSRRSDKPSPTTHYCLRFCWLAVVLVLFGAGCKQESKGTASIDPVGTYTLAKIDGKLMPCTLSHEGRTLTIKSGVFTINADGSCSSQTTFSVPAGGDTTRAVKATYSRQGTTLTMKWEGAGMTLGTFDGSTFTMTNEGMIFSYRR